MTEENKGENGRCTKSAPESGWKSDQEKIKELEEMVDRAHDALNKLMQNHMTITSDAWKIAYKGLFAD